MVDHIVPNEIAPELQLEETNLRDATTLRPSGNKSFMVLENAIKSVQSNC
jgi:hypothetical protein